MPQHADIAERELTEPQRRAIASIDAHAAVVAGAGSGKTLVLIERLRRIIGGDWSRLDRLLAITFTEKAAAELKARLRPHVPPRHRHRLESAWIGTFHACCARLVRQHAPLLGIDPAFAIIDENAAGLAMRQAVRQTLLALLGARDPDAALLVDALDFRSAVGALEELMQFRWHARQALASPESTDADEADILRSLQGVWRHLERASADHLARMGALDFQELEIRALELLAGFPEVHSAYRRRFQHLLVDEFQDTSDAQTELVLALFAPRDNRLLIVGDPRQSIYRFRGANPDCFAAALEAVAAHGGETIHLAHNFRSRPEIVRFVNACQESLADGLFGKLAADGIGPASEGMIAGRKGPEAEANAVVALALELPADEKAEGRRRAEAEAIAAFAAELVSRGAASTGDIVCLFQALTAVAIYESAFRRAGIPCRVFGGRGLLDRQEIADLLSVLAAAAHPDDELAVLALLRSPLIGLSDDDLVLLAGPRGADLLRAALADPRCALLREIRAMADHRRPSEILRAAMDATGFERLLASLDPSGGAGANVERFLALVCELERQGPSPLPDLLGYLRELRERSARLGDPPAAGDAGDAVRCMSVHAAKGLEFPVVILPDLFRSPPQAAGHWRFLRGRGIAFRIKDPLRPFGERRESERFAAFKADDAAAAEAEGKRLLYVAMTRAQEMLVLPVHRGIPKKNEGPWHRWLLPVIEREGVAVRPAATAEAGAVSPSGAQTAALKTPREPSRIAHDRRRSFSVSELEAYDRCPREHDLKYVLGLPASRLFAGDAAGLAANVVGSIVHGVLEGLDPAAPESIPSLIDLACLKNGILPEKRALHGIRRAVESALALPFARRLGEGRREVRFDWTLRGSLISGSIDWMLPADGGWEIVDFKTDDVDEGRAPERARDYALQLVCYALAAEAATGERVAATSLAFLTPGVVICTPMDDARRAEGKARIEAIIDAIGSGRMMASTAPPCRSCPYHHNGLCWEDRLRPQREENNDRRAARSPEGSVR